MTFGGVKSHQSLESNSSSVLHSADGGLRDAIVLAQHICRFGWVNGTFQMLFKLMGMATPGTRQWHCTFACFLRLA